MYGWVKNLLFELGVDFIGLLCLCFLVKYVLVVMLFVIFGIEMLFFYFWVVLLWENGWVGFVEVMLFVFLLLVGLFYLYWVGVFDWLLECWWKKLYD